jgi:hypothetical protein
VVIFLYDLVDGNMLRIVEGEMGFTGNLLPVRQQLVVFKIGNTEFDLAAWA